MEFFYDWRGLFNGIFYGLKNPKWYGSFKEVGVYYDVVVNSDNVVCYGFPEPSADITLDAAYDYLAVCPKLFLYLPGLQFFLQ